MNMEAHEFFERQDPISSFVYEKIISFCGSNDGRFILSHVEVIDEILEFLMRKQI